MQHLCCRKSGHQSYKALGCMGTNRSIHRVYVKSDGQIKEADYCHFHLTTSSPDFYIVNHVRIPAYGILNSKPPTLLIRWESSKAQEKLYWPSDSCFNFLFFFQNRKKPQSIYINILLLQCRCNKCHPRWQGNLKRGVKFWVSPTLYLGVITVSPDWFSL